MKKKKSIDACTKPILHEQELSQDQFVHWIVIDLSWNFSISVAGYQAKVKEPGLPYYLPIDGGKIDEFIPFPRVIIWQYGMRIASFKIWNRVTVSISYDDNHYTTSASQKL